MSDAINVKGTHDILPEESKYYSDIETMLGKVATLFAYQEIRTPVIEYSNTFIRGVGEGSDIVRKEMYTFDDKGGRSITLRPEFTAGIIRSIVQNKLYAVNELPYKVFYCGPVFRYERPQLGRYRQFNQFGVESIGHNSPINDVEVIIMAYVMLQSLGLENVTLKINTLGDEATRNSYRDALKEYFAKHIDNMCPDCKSRFELNPLRILDCKVPEDQEIAKGAPKISEYLSKESKDRFDTILNRLKTIGIPFEIDEQLVRGLDYYNETVFEFHYTSSKGNDYGAIGAGGHYGNLVKEFGGPEYPGIGFSFGIERLYSVMKDDNLLPEDNSQNIFAYVMPLGQESLALGEELATTLRVNGYITDICFDEVKMANMFKRASKKNAKVAIIIGEDEIKKGVVVVKNLQTQEQFEVSKNNLIKKLDEINEQGHEHHCHCHEDEHECHCHDNEEEHECCCGHHHEEEE